MISCLLLALLLSTCDSPTNPDDDKGNNGPDTTSQDFTFEVFEFGDGGSSSYVNDVWIFSETNIWAVGWFAQDSFAGNCNMVRWNGQEWEYINTSPVSTSSGIFGIWALDSNNVYLANGSIGKVINGSFQRIDFSELNWPYITHLWGSSAENIWGVGPKGTVVHYDGVKWQKKSVPSPEPGVNPYNYSFSAITGDSISGAAYLLMNYVTGYDSKTQIYKATPDTVIPFFNNVIDSQWDITNVWDIEMIDENRLATMGFSIFLINVSNKTYQKIHTIKTDGVYLNFKITSNGPNDIFYMNRYTDLTMHYNGIRWNKLKLTGIEDNIYHYQIRTKGNITAIVGWHNKPSEGKRHLGHVQLIKRIEK